MGAEAQCTAHFAGASSDGKALLETDYLLFRGTFRVRIPFKDIQAISADEHELSIRFPAGTARFQLGALAKKWLEKIKNPPTLLHKLGIREKSRVLLAGVSDDRLIADLKQCGADVLKRAAGNCDFILLQMESAPDLERIAGMRKHMKPDSAIWLIWPKGQKHITEAQVITAARAAGFIDTKVAGFSPTHTALKVVIPAANRK
jgi:hypothetical protein